MVRAWGQTETPTFKVALSVSSGVILEVTYTSWKRIFMYKMGIKMFTCRIVVKN